MSKKLTTKLKEETVIEFSEENSIRFARKEDANGVISYYSGKSIDKLGQLEDVLEKYGIDTAEELDGVLKALIENGQLEKVVGNE